MAVTVNTGLVGTADPLSNDLAVSMDSKVGVLDSDASQFSTMLMKLPVSQAKSFKEEWLNIARYLRPRSLWPSVA